MPVDLTVFERQKSIVDQQQLQDAFNMKKALAAAQIQSNQQRAALDFDQARREQQLLDYKMQEASKGVDAPSSVREYQFFNQLPEDQKKAFLNVKRAAQIQNLGSGFGVYNPVDGAIAPISGGGIGMTPAQSDDMNRKNRELQEQFNRGVDVKEKALQTVYRLIGNPSAALGTPEYEGNIAGVKANRGRFSSQFPNVFSGAIDAEADLNYLTNLLTTENLGLLKGVLSDTDMQILKNIGSGDLMGSDEKSIAALQRLRDILGKKVEAGRAIQEQGFGNLPPPPLSTLGMENTGDLPPAPGGTPPAVDGRQNSPVDYKSKYGLK